VNDEEERRLAGRLLTPAPLVRWAAGLMFLIPGLIGVVAAFVAPGVGVEYGMVSTILAAAGVLVLASGKEGARIANETPDQRRKRLTTNSGCTLGLLAGIVAFAAFNFVVGPLLAHFHIRTPGLPFRAWALVVLLVVGSLGSLWGIHRARKG
jgi:hypothetical protein